MLNVGVIGYGYWGPNIVRNFNGIEGSRVQLICDGNPNAITRAKKAHPHIDTTGNWQDVISSPEIYIIAVITPVSTHFELAKKALENGKHIFIEKPFTATVAQAEEL
ncbi:MAG: Gfo/Idh/MocA family oxidoreductase, partial [Nitrospira sp.]|nr:Gfo/Idh/MocA family oxidoreductase [Nitrospira sp.]